jgi:hypothetical protein
VGTAENLPDLTDDQRATVVKIAKTNHPLYPA